MTDLESRVRRLEAQLDALQRQVGTPPGLAARGPLHHATASPALDAVSAWERFLDLAETDLDLIRADRGFLSKVTPLGMVADAVVLSVTDSVVKRVVETQLHDAFVRHLSAAAGQPVRIAVTIAAPRPAGEVIPFGVRHPSPFSLGAAEELSAEQRNAGPLRGFLIDEPGDDDDGLDGVLARVG